MKIDERIRLISGFYAPEANHVWGGGGTIYVLISDCAFKRVRIEFFLAKNDSRLWLCDCARGSKKEIQFSNDEPRSFEIDVFENSALYKLECEKTLIPQFEIPNNNNYRCLGIGIASAEVVGDVTLPEFKMEKNASLFYLSMFRKNFIHDSDYYFFSEIKCDIPGIVLDIGANIGQSATSITAANKSAKILSFEPNKLLEPNLKLVKMLLGDIFNYRMYGIGSEDSCKKFYVPHCGKKYFSQEGSFVVDEILSDLAMSRMEANVGVVREKIEIEEFMFEIRTLLNENFESYFIKIDTQGFEVETLKGIKNIVEKNRPVIIMEKGFDENAVLSLLPNYKIWFFDYKLRKLVNSDTKTANVFLIPKTGTKCKEINAFLKKIIEYLKWPEEFCRDIVLELEKKILIDDKYIFYIKLTNNSQLKLNKSNKIAKISYHLFDGKNVVNWDYDRFDIPSLNINESIIIEIPIDKKSIYICENPVIQFDLVIENEYWFSEKNMKPFEIIMK